LRLIRGKFLWPKAGVNDPLAKVSAVIPDVMLLADERAESVSTAAAAHWQLSCVPNQIWGRARGRRSLTRVSRLSDVHVHSIYSRRPGVFSHLQFSQIRGRQPYRLAKHLIEFILVPLGDCHNLAATVGQQIQQFSFVASKKL
jgi:hypothetical protein